MSDAHVAEAVNAAVKAKPSCTSSVESLIAEAGKQFIEQQIDRFPWYCYEARRVNAIARQQLQLEGNPNGWSADKSFKFDFEIPRDLYLFMVNLVYKDFWAESNERIWRKFMTGICRGDDAMDWLKGLKIYYGSSKALQASGEL